MAKTPTKPSAKPYKSTESNDDLHLSLEGEIDRQIGDLVPQGARQQVVARMTTLMVSEHFSGPIAHPRHLREYEDVCPGSADRIIRMAEERNKHIMDMERKVLLDNIDDQRRGMNYGAGLFAFLIGSALASALFGLGPGIVALFLSTAALGSIAMFIKGRNGSSGN